MKKVISIMIVIALVACMLCVPAFADYREENGEYINIIGGHTFPAFPLELLEYDAPNYVCVLFFEPGFDSELFIFDTSIIENLSIDERGNFKAVFSSDANISSFCFGNNEISRRDQTVKAGDVRGYSYVVWASRVLIDSDTGEEFDFTSSVVLEDGRVYPDDFVSKDVPENPLDNTIDAVDTTLDTGLGMVNSVAKTISSSPLLFVCFAVGFIGIGVALFKRIRK